MVRSLDSKDAKPLFKPSSRVLYAPPGYLLYVREQTLVAQAFDTRSLQITGEPIPIGEGLGVNATGLASFSFSRTGTLAFRVGGSQGRRLVWLDRSGKETPVLEEARGYGDTSLSPDGQRLAFDMAGDIWIRDLVRGVTSRFTFDAEPEFTPVWSSDGRRIVFTKILKEQKLLIKDAAGTGEAVPLLEGSENKYASDWSRDGAYVLYGSQGQDTGWDLWALPAAGDRKPLPLVRTRFNEDCASLSPDGKLLAYRSYESGRPEVYVQEFPEARNKWQVSANGGNDPFWRGDSRELYYRAPNGRIMAVPVEAGATFTAGAAQSLFEAQFAPLANLRALFRPTPDGKRFLVVAPMGRAAIQPATVVLNWPSALR
jgi:dipeptidyl aminopeptidase/acylaminoacyl peptidase